MVRGLCPKFDLEAYRAGHLTPVFFGSAVNNFGVRELLARPRGAGAAAARAADARARGRARPRTKVSGFVFKIQANMDPKHRDRIAFVRLALGALHARHEAHRAAHRQAARRAQRDAVPGATSASSPRRRGPATSSASRTTARCGIGDALTEGETLHFTGIPSFAPEFLRRVRADDPMKAKHLGRALEQIAEEGARAGVQAVPRLATSIVGVVGALQFDVLADRIRSEYDLPCHFEATSFEVARWVDADDPKLIKKFADANRDNIAEDHSRRDRVPRAQRVAAQPREAGLAAAAVPADARAGAAHRRLGVTCGRFALAFWRRA